VGINSTDVQKRGFWSRDFSGKETSEEHETSSETSSETFDETTNE